MDEDSLFVDLVVIHCHAAEPAETQSPETGFPSVFVEQDGLAAVVEFGIVAVEADTVVAAAAGPDTADGSLLDNHCTWKYCSSAYG